MRIKRIAANVRNNYYGRRTDYFSAASGILGAHASHSFFGSS